MIQVSTLEHRFIGSIPRVVEPGILYVSMEYGTAIHSCCCGCGEQVVTPFSPTDWKMTYDGESVSLAPSVGNWNSTCRSHYVIRRGRVIEASSWSDAQVAAERARDAAAKARFYGTAGKPGMRQDAQARSDAPAVPVANSAGFRRRGGGFWSSVKTWFRRNVRED